MSLIRILPVLLVLSAGIANGNEENMIEYERHEFRGVPESRKAELSTFVYDIPYFGACGIFPPLHIINQYFKEEGSTGGMSPGATWAPFTIDEEEYARLVKEIENLDPGTLGDTARYTQVKFEFDHNFDHIDKLESWLFKVCDKHRDSYHKKLGNL